MISRSSADLNAFYTHAMAQLLYRVQVFIAVPATAGQESSKAALFPSPPAHARDERLAFPLPASTLSRMSFKGESWRVSFCGV